MNLSKNNWSPGPRKFIKNTTTIMWLRGDSSVLACRKMMALWNWVAKELSIIIRTRSQTQSQARERETAVITNSSTLNKWLKRQEHINELATFRSPPSWILAYNKNWTYFISSPWTFWINRGEDCLAMVLGWFSMAREWLLHDLAQPCDRNGTLGMVVLTPSPWPPHLARLRTRGCPAYPRAGRAPNVSKRGKITPNASPTEFKLVQKNWIGVLMWATDLYNEMSGVLMCATETHMQTYRSAS